MAAVERTERSRQTVAADSSAALCPDGRAAMEDVRGGSSRAAVSGLARAPRNGMAIAAGVLGTAEPAGDQPGRPYGEMRRRGWVPAAHSRLDRGAVNVTPGRGRCGVCR